MSEVSRYQPINKFTQLLILVISMIGGALLGMLTSCAIIKLLWGAEMWDNIRDFKNVDAPGFVSAFRFYLSWGNTIMVFLIPSLIFGCFLVSDPDGYLKVRTRVGPGLLLLVVAFMIFFYPVVELAIYYNQNWHFQPKQLDDLVRSMEQQTNDVIKVALAMPNWWTLLLNLVLIAFLPAFAEELFFRGCMQTVLQNMIKNTHVAVWISAFAFSFLHFEFLGFVPRLLLGAGLGYLCAWSGSIWPSVFAHFLNNGFAVVVTYLYQHGQIKTNPDSNELMFTQQWNYLLCFIVSIAILYVYKRIAAKNLVYADGEELD